MEIKDIIQLMEAAAKNGLTSFELEEGDWKLSMKREKKLVSAAVPAAEAGAQSAAASGILSAASSGMSASVRTKCREFGGKSGFHGSVRRFFRSGSDLSAGRHLLFRALSGRGGFCKGRRYRKEGPGIGNR